MQPNHRCAFLACGVIAGQLAPLRPFQSDEFTTKAPKTPRIHQDDFESEKFSACHVPRGSSGLRFAKPLSDSSGYLCEDLGVFGVLVVQTALP
jgi:hypothetical protein